MLKYLPLLALVLAPLMSPVAADTYPRQPGVDVQHYIFRLAVGDESNEIRGDTSVRIRFRAEVVREVILDLASVSNGKGMTVLSVLSDGRPLAFTHEADRLRLPLSGPVQPGQERTFTVEYRGIPADGLRFIENMHGERTAFSENWPNRARLWLPTVDHPYDKATGEFIVTAPAHYQVVANGLLVEELDLPDGRRRTHFRQSVPIASWLYALGMARFAVHHAGKVQGVPLQSWVFPQDRAPGYRLFEMTTRQAMDFFSERIGPYSFEKIANVQAAGIGGGTEHATIIFYGEQGVASGRGPVVHEVAHQWWGNAVTERDWDDVWLSEGFATYFTHLFREHYEGREAFVAGLKRDLVTVLGAQEALPLAPVIHENLSDMQRVLNRLVYQKGSWVLHMLRRLVGDDAFWNGIREYYRIYREGNASTAEFREVMERVSGSNLNWFFRQWLNRGGMPKLQGHWVYQGATRQVVVTLEQTQPGEPFRLPIELGIVAEPGAAPRVERFELTGRRVTVSFGVDRDPVSVVLDPQTWLLTDLGRFVRSGGRGIGASGGGAGL